MTNTEYEVFLAGFKKSLYQNKAHYDDQPYLIYRHYDTGHPHVHVVATAILVNGKYMHLDRSGYKHSHELCRSLEKEYSLESPVAARLRQKEEFAVDHAQRVSYGERSLTRAMSDVLNTVVEHYNYSSLDEFNAVLKQYNVEANPGLEGSRLRATDGLLYYAIDDEGHHIGAPLPASSFLLKPTLKNLREKFELNRACRESLREHVTTAIDWALAGLDHSSRSSFEGLGLDNGYGLEALRSRCAPAPEITDEQTLKQNLRLAP